jgi:4-diphosphocytidyl-2-C-methyl-D-erythritol kinase
LKELAPAKINLGLHVIGKRSDGYHDIETVMLRIPWSDFLDVVPDKTLSLTCDDQALPTGSQNLCMKAARALALRSGTARGARMHLTKNVPVGAGLGGGSSDAAATLRVLRRLWSVDISDDELVELAAELGADVPFFLGPTPALAQGIGEALTPLTNNAGSGLEIPFTFVVIKPEVSVSTPDAYRWVTPSDAGRVDLADVVGSLDLDRWREELVNDFEGPVIERIPEIGVARDLLLQAGAGFAAMSGSGSAVYGVFENEEMAKAVKEAAGMEGYTSWVGEAL